MKGIITGLMLMLMFTAVPAYAAGRTETLSVQIHNEKRAVKSKLSIRFLELVEDSRCPTDTNCVWAGNGKIKVSVKRGNGAARVFEMDTNGPNKTISHAGYKITLSDLTPHPRSNIRINRNGYVAKLAIVKAGR